MYHRIEKFLFEDLLVAQDRDKYAPPQWWSNTLWGGWLRKTIRKLSIRYKNRNRK